jgi:hypothetical protein
MSGLDGALLADCPHASLGEHAHLFDQFVGAWEYHYAHLAEDGRVTEESDGRVTFGSIIDGWAMQDAWSGGEASAHRSASAVESLRR